MVVQSARSLLQAIRLAVKAGVRSTPPDRTHPHPTQLISRIRPRLQSPTSIQHPSIKLNHKFTQLLNHLSTNPILRGAKNVFLQSSSHSHSHFATSSSSSPILRNLARHPNAFKSSSARFNSGGLRISTLPIKPSMRTGGAMGLQTARNFSSGTGGRGFDLIITNAPLALRALGNELLEKDGKSKGMGKQSRGTRRLGNKGVKQSQKLALQRSLRSSSSIQSSSLKSSLTSSDDKENKANLSSSIDVQSFPTSQEEIKMEYDHYWCPCPVVNFPDQYQREEEEGPHQGNETTLHLALDPNLSSILIRKPLPSHSSSSDNDLLNQSFLDSLRDLKDSFINHKVFLSRILRTLRELKVLNSYDPVLLSYENFQLGQEVDEEVINTSSSSFSLELKFKGWKEVEILEMLKDRIGKSLVEDHENLMLFVEKRDPLVYKEDGQDQDQEDKLNLEEIVRDGLNSTQDFDSPNHSEASSPLSQSLEFIHHQDQDVYSSQFSSSVSDMHGSHSFSEDLSSTLIIPQVPIDVDGSYETIRQGSPTSSIHSDGSSISDPDSPRSDLSSLADSIEFLDHDESGDVDGESEDEMEDSMLGSRIV